jgi:ribulose-phosphate 3-epimerase
MQSILPAVLAHSEHTCLGSLKHPDLKNIDVFHLDVMDGTFTKERSWFDPRSLRKHGNIPKLELHLMVNEPLEHLSTFHGLPVVRAIVHHETLKNAHTTLTHIKLRGLEAGLAFNPETAIDVAQELCDVMDEVLVMGVKPGASGQPFLGDSVMSRIKRLRSLCPNLTIGVDGGVSLENIQLLRQAGATRFVASSAIFGNPHPHDAYLTLQEKLTANS